MKVADDGGDGGGGCCKPQGLFTPSHESEFINNMRQRVEVMPIFYQRGER